MSRKRIEWYKDALANPAGTADAGAAQPAAARQATPGESLGQPATGGPGEGSAAPRGSNLAPLPAIIIPGRPARPLVPGLFSIAPMIDKTSRHFRWFLRQMTKRAVLYTEMVTAPAIIHGKRDILLDFDPIEHPIMLQVGGDDPAQIAEALRIAEDWGYDEYNLNVGCPSDKVQVGRFGACLMADPGRVAEIVAAMASVTTKPITVKHRIGIEGFGYHRESFEEMADFVATVASAGCDRFIVHARIAMLEGLSPRENRSVPPIRYEEVYRLKALYPNLRVELNGQIKTLEECATHLDHGMDGLMIGRASYESPMLMAQLDAFEEAWFGGLTDPAIPASGNRQSGDRSSGCNSSSDVPGRPAAGFPPQARLHGPAGHMVSDQALARSGSFAQAAFDRRALVLAWADYIDRWQERGLNPRSLVWPILELFPAVPGARKYRQVLSRTYTRGVSMAALAREALAQLPGETV